MGKTYGWSLAGVVLLGGMAGAQGTQPNSTQIKPAQTQPGQAQPGQIQPGQRQIQPGQVQPGRVQPGQVQPGQARTVPGQGGGQRQLNQMNGEQEVAALLAACNRNEVEVAKFAMDKLQSDEAKELATMLVKEHTAAAEKFEQLAGQTGRIRAGEGEQRRDDRRDNDRRDNERSDATRDDNNRQNAQTNAATAPNSPTARVAVQGNAVQPNLQPGTTAQPRIALKPAMAGHLDWSTIHQEIADESLRGCKEELSRYEGKEFDKAFLGHQLGAHLKAATELKVLSRHVSGQLASEIETAHATTEKHIKHLRELMDEKKDEK